MSSCVFSGMLLQIVRLLVAVGLFHEKYVFLASELLACHLLWRAAADCGCWWRLACPDDTLRP